MFAEVQFEHMMPLWAIASALVLAAAVLLAALWRYLGPSLLSASLALLRLLFLALLGWCLLMPLQRRSRIELLKPRFLVALDRSASMTLSPDSAIPARWDVAQGILTQEWTRIVGAGAQLDLYAFDVDPGARLDLAEAAATPEGTATHLRESLARLVERYRGQQVAGLLLLSDGLDTRETSAMWARQSWPFPIHTVRLEPDVAWAVTPDVRVDAIETPRRVNVGWNSELKAVVSGEGTAGQMLAVRLSRDGVPVQELPTQIPAEGGSRDVTFELTHDSVGVFTYTVDVDPLPAEVKTNDNTFAVTVQVMDSKNHLLYVEGIPRWESKYLIRALRAIEDLTPLAFVRGPDGRFLTYGTRGSMTLDMTESQLAHFKIVICGDLDSEGLGEERAAALLRFVERGGSLVLLGGPLAWGERGVDTTALARLLPVTRPGRPPAEEGQFSVSPTPDGLAHPALATDSAWLAALPPVLSVFPGAIPGAGAVSLIEAATPRGPAPLVVAQRYGQGKVVAVLSDTLWRWQLNPGRENPYFRFWSQILQWMLPAEAELEEHRIDLFADADRLHLGESIALNARLTTPADAGDFDLTCEIATPDGRRLPFAMTRRTVSSGAGRQYAGFGVDFRSETSGLYRAVAFTTIAGGRVESAPYSFFVKPFTAESTPRPADAELLRILASESGGRFMEAGDAQAVLAALTLPTQEEEYVSYSTLWNTLLVLACLIGLLTVEWILRKVKSMP